MGYCVIADVQALNSKRDYNASTAPSTAQLQALIETIAAEIDITLAGRGYTVPVNSPLALMWILKTINAYGAAALAEASMFPETSEKGATPHYKVLQDRYQLWLEKMGRGELTGVLAGRAAGSLFTDGSIDSEEYTGPRFTIGKVY